MLRAPRAQFARMGALCTNALRRLARAAATGLFFSASCNIQHANIHATCSDMLKTELRPGAERT
eukprot:1693388-Pyramimonas_sp.AAC.1